MFYRDINNRIIAVIKIYFVAAKYFIIFSHLYNMTYMHKDF